MFEYFFIIGALLLLVSGSLDGLNLNKPVCAAILTALFLLSFLPNFNFKYIVYFSFTGLFIAALAFFMTVCLKQERYEALITGLTLGIFVWVVITISPSLNTWYFKAVVCSVIGVCLGTGYLQASVISVTGCLCAEVFSLILAMDYELITMPLFIGSSRTCLIISLILPIIFASMPITRQKELFTKNADGVS
ncbi:MAG: hypothetical protein IJR47_05225 [Clostridia bacterium]|nr:hypothetical protein [Clostridia bacterium]